MNGWITGWTDRYIVGSMDGWMEMGTWGEYMTGQVDGEADRKLDRWVHREADR